MKYEGRDPYGKKIVGTLHKEWSNGITIEYENGVREFINKERVIGPVVEQYSGDLFK
jgi:hypothetical protein